MPLLDPPTWSGKIHIDGWVPGAGPEYTVREPASGGELGKLGSAAPADVRQAAARAREAQAEWAARPYDQRAAVLQRAADLFSEHSDEISNWIVRGPLRRSVA